jgi:hypothetical protein
MKGITSILLIGSYFAMCVCLFSSKIFWGSFPGDFDTWANLALYNDLINALKNILAGSIINTFNYPDKHSWLGFGLDFFSGIGYAFFKLLNFSDYYAYWINFLLTLSLNGMAMFYLSSIFTQNRHINFIAGVFLISSNYTIAQFDHPNVLIWWPFILSLTNYCEYTIHSSEKNLKWFLLFATIQLLLSPVIFAISAFALCLLIVNRLTLVGHFFSKRLLPYTMLLLSAVLIYGWLYVYFLPSLGYINKLDETTVVHRSFSATPEMLFIPLNGNLLYTTLQFRDEWQKYQSLFLGLLLPCLCISALLFNKKGYEAKKTIALLITIGLLLSMGSWLTIGSNTIRLPGYYLYQNLYLSYFLRLPIRAFFLVFIGLILLATQSLNLISNMAYGKIILVFVVAFFILENVPFHDRNYKSTETLNYCKAAGFCSGPNKNCARSITLHLPSKILDENSDRREYIYMLINSYQENATINGASAYFSKERLLNNTCIVKLDERNLQNLIEWNSLSYIFVHRNYFDSEAEYRQTCLLLQQTKRLKLYANCLSVLVYKVVE